MYQEWVSSLLPLNVEARYPKEKEKLLKSLNLQKCNEILLNTEGLLEWIKRQLQVG